MTLCRCNMVKTLKNYGKGVKDLSVLVTGANGFLGGRELYWMKEHGYNNVIGSDLADPTYKLPSGYSWRKGDITDEKSLEYLLDKVDIVVNNAAVFNFGASEELLNKVNAEAPVKMLKILDKNQKESGLNKYLVQISSGTVYKPTFDSDQMVHENSPLGPIEPYGKSKLKCEQNIADFLKNNDTKVKTSIIRPAVIYGPMFPTGSSYGAAIACLSQDILSRLGLGLTGVPLGGENTRACYVHVDDVCKLTSFIIERGQWDQTFNAVSQTLITHKELGRIVSDALDLPWYRRLLSGKSVPLPEKLTLNLAKLSDLAIKGLQNKGINIPTLGMEGNIKYMFAPAFAMSPAKAVSKGFVHDHPNDHHSMKKVLKEYIDAGWPTILGPVLSKPLKRK